MKKLHQERLFKHKNTLHCSLFFSRPLIAVSHSHFFYNSQLKCPRFARYSDSHWFALSPSLVSNFSFVFTIFLLSRIKWHLAIVCLLPFSNFSLRLFRAQRPPKKNMKLQTSVIKATKNTGFLCCNSLLMAEERVTMPTATYIICTRCFLRLPFIHFSVCACVCYLSDL